MLHVGESYNKAFEYFAARKPVLYTVKPGYSIIEKYHCGMIVDGFSPDRIAEKIDAIATMDKSEIEVMEHNTEEVTKDYNFTVLTEKLIKILNKYM
ncbi:hypothetical protein H6A13_12985 [Mordavella massiliensis]|uniref:Uncharacterized protein n=1 Tax=Mordavella massiliensis TaxID=1871024 RepID=A0A939BD61_9CLOT|nr:hypothetical protein [Mordavella massiliensis]